eukprot:7167137-Pyramimonas_sp.AAC.1
MARPRTSTQRAWLAILPNRRGRASLTTRTAGAVPGPDCIFGRVPSTATVCLPLLDAMCSDSLRKTRGGSASYVTARSISMNSAVRGGGHAWAFWWCSAGRQSSDCSQSVFFYCCWGPQ